MGRPRKVRPEEVSATNNDHGIDDDVDLRNSNDDTSTATLDAPPPPATRQKFIPGEPSQPTTDLRTEIGDGAIIVSTKKYREPSGANHWNTVVYNGSVSETKIRGNWFTVGEAERRHSEAVADETAAYESRKVALQAHGLI